MIQPDERARQGARETDKASLFTPDDPRAGPFTPAEIEEARRYASEPGRWHRERHTVDWFAVRLQYGRGMSIARTAALFGISDRRIYRRRDRGKWVACMSERDRRTLARLVWLAGIARIPARDAEALRMLATTSEWRPIVREEFPAWQPQDPKGEAVPWIMAAVSEHS